MIIGCVCAYSQMNVSFTFFAGAFVGAAMGLGMGTAVRPTALSVAPFSPKQRMVFSFLSSICIAVMISLVYLAAMVVFSLLVALIAFCVSGENIMAYEPMGLSAYGIAFTLLTIALFFFATYAIFHLERRRNITIASIVFVVLMEVFALVIVNMCAKAAPHVTSSSFVIYAPVPELIALLNAPWVVIVVLGVFNALAIAACIFLTVRRFKSDKV